MIDNALQTDSPQFYAFLTAKAELERQTCIQFYPRNNEEDFFNFVATGDKLTCWNIFEKPSGPVNVNVGSECLPPFGSYNDATDIRESFSDCDIAYLNELYQCDPRRYHLFIDKDECLERENFRKKLFFPVLKFSAGPIIINFP